MTYYQTIAYRLSKSEKHKTVIKNPPLNADSRLGLTILIIFIVVETKETDVL